MYPLQSLYINHISIDTKFPFCLMPIKGYYHKNAVFF